MDGLSPPTSPLSSPLEFPLPPILAPTPPSSKSTRNGRSIPSPIWTASSPRPSLSKNTRSTGLPSSPPALPSSPARSMELTAKGNGAFGDLDEEGIGEAGLGAARSQPEGGARSNGTASVVEENGVPGARNSSAAKESRKGVSQAALPSPSTRSQFAHSTSSAPTNHHRISSRNTLPYNTDSRPSPSTPFASAPQHPNAAAPSQASRFLLTVVPPMHLPHDPPHPRTSQACSGYGPPEKFRRGTLVPLYPTLSSQLAAIAREYGLPSTGGLVIYLLSTSDPSSATNAALPDTAGLAGEGGPRIGEEAWSLLWERLFQEEEEEILLEGENESATDEEYDDIAPPVPPIPRSHLANISHLHDLQDDGVAGGETAASTPLSERRIASDSDAALFSDAEHEQTRTSFSSDVDGSVYSQWPEQEGAGSRRNRQGSASASAGRRPSTSSSRFGIGRGPPPSLPSSVSNSRGAKGLSSFSTSSQPNLRQTSRQSVTSTRSLHSRSYHNLYPSSGRSTSTGSYSAAPLGGAGYGSSIVVGKVEFDIDWRRGGRSRWYEGWVEAAENAVTPGSSTLPSPLPGYTDGTSDGGERTMASRNVSSGTNGPPPARQELHLPNLVGLRRTQEDSVEVLDRPPAPEMRVRTASGRSRAVESGMSGYSMAAVAGHSGVDEDDVPLRGSPRSASPSPSRLSTRSRSSSILSPVEEGVAPLSSLFPDAVQQLGYAPIPANEEQGNSPLSNGDDDSYAPLSPADDEGYAPLDDESYTPLAGNDAELDEELLPRKASVGSKEDSLPSDYDDVESDLQTAGDPLGDVFPSDEATWQTMSVASAVAEEEEDEVRRESRELAMLETTGLGIMGARIEGLAAPAGVLERQEQDETNDEAGLPPPQDDVSDIVSLLKSGQSENKDDAVNLASPIHLSSSTFESAKSNRDSLTPRVAQLIEDDDDLATSSGRAPDVADSPPTSISDRAAQVQRRGVYDWAQSPNLDGEAMDHDQIVAASPVVFPPTAEASPVARDLAPSGSHRESQRNSTIGLMEDLDDLERALEELSPRNGSRSRGGPSSNGIPLFAAPLPFTMEAPAHELSADDNAFSDDESFESPGIELLQIPDSQTTSPSNSVPTSPLLATRPVYVYPTSAGGRPSSRPTSRPIPSRPEGPARTLTADMPGYGRDSALEILAPPSPSSVIEPTTPLPSVHPAIAPTSPPSIQDADPIASRTPRTSSLAKVAAVPGPSIPPPALPTPVQSDDQRISRALPPVPPTQPLVASEPPLLPTPSTSRSPVLKSLRSWKSDKGDKSPNSSRKRSSEPGESETAKKSFFEKPARKLNAFLRKRSDSSPDHPDSSLSSDFPPVEMPVVEMPRTSESSLPPIITTGPRDIFPRVPITPTSPTSGSSTSSPLPTSSPSYSHQQDQSSLTAPVRQLRSVGSSESFGAAMASLADSPSGADDTEDLPAQPPLPYNSRDVALSSPRSEYAPPTPTTPGPSMRYPASAPATPVAWTKNAEAGSSRFGRQRPKHRLSADIDNLLLQMNEIDFGDDDSFDDRTESESSASTSQHRGVGGSSNPIVTLSPVSENEGNRASGEQPPRFGSSSGQTAPLEEEDDAGGYSQLGSMMTSLGPESPPARA